MKFYKLTMPLVLLAAALFVGCDKDSLIDEIASEGDGAVQLLCSANQGVSEVQTRADEKPVKQLPAGLIPQIGEFAMTLEGEYTNRFEPAAENLPEGATVTTNADNTWTVKYTTSWEKISQIGTITDNKLTINKLKTGKYDTTNQVYLNSYKVKISYGETTGEGENVKYVEGRNKPCFKGVSVDDNNAEAPFTIKPKETSQIKVLATLSNSCFVMNFTDWMLAYFKNIEIKIHTADNLFTFTQVMGETGYTFNYKHEKIIVTTTTTPPTEEGGQTTTTTTTTYEKVEEKTGLTLAEDNDGNNLLKDENGEVMHIFVNPGQKLSFSGSAKKSQTGTTAEFEKIDIGELLAAKSCYEVTVDCDTAGAGEVVRIGFNEEWEDGGTTDVNIPHPTPDPEPDDEEEPTPNPNPDPNPNPEGGEPTTPPATGDEDGTDDSGNNSENTEGGENTNPDNTTGGTTEENTNQNTSGGGTEENNS